MAQREEADGPDGDTGDEPDDDTGDETDDEASDQLERVRTYWERIGRSAPYWGVLTDVKYTGRELDDAVADQFWDSGAGEVALFEDLLRRHARVGLEALDAVGPFLELGCGVCRIALYMARRCRRQVVQ